MWRISRRRPGVAGHNAWGLPHPPLRSRLAGATAGRGDRRADRSPERSDGEPVPAAALARAAGRGHSQASAKGCQRSTRPDGFCISSCVAQMSLQDARYRCTQPLRCCV